MRSLRLALLSSALFLCLAAPAAASRTQESIFEDEHQLLELGPGVANRALDHFAYRAELHTDGSGVVIGSFRKERHGSCASGQSIAALARVQGVCPEVWLR